METIRMLRNNCTLVAIKEVTGADDAAVLAAVRSTTTKTTTACTQTTIWLRRVTLELSLAK